jgi:hypothetical protein
LTAAGEVLAMGDQTLVQLAAQQGDALHPGVMTKPVAGHADLGIAGLKQQALCEIRPLPDRDFDLGDQGRRPGERDTNESTQMRAYALSPILVCLGLAGLNRITDASFGSFG